MEKKKFINKLTLGIVLILFAHHPPLIAQSGSELSFRPQLLLIDNNEACSIGDVDRDGLMDVIAGRLWFGAPEFVPRPLRPLRLHPPEYASNNGEANWDVDGDGWVDVIATGWGEKRLRWFKNPGMNGLRKGLEWKEYVLADMDNPHGEAAYLMDIDQDGQPEYIMNSYVRTKPFMVWRFSRDSAGVRICEGIEIGPHNSHGAGFGDVNGDGKTDILFDDGWYEQPDKDPWKGHWVLHRDWKLKGGSCPFQVIDLNQDGRMDFIWGRGHDYGLYWMEQGIPQGDSTTWTRHTIDESWSQVHALTWADLDGDGQGELITGKRIWAHTGKDPGSADPSAIYRYVWNEAEAKFQRYTIAEGNIGTGLFIRTADLNTDGKMDLVVAGKTGTYILWQE